MDDAAATGNQTHVSTDRVRPGSRWRLVWPAALGVLVAAGTAYGLTDGRDVAAVVAASGLVYLSAAAIGRRWVAWAAFGATFALITLDKLTGFSATTGILLLAAVMLAAGLLGRRGRPFWGLPLQTAAMIALGGIALIAIRLDPTAGGLLVAAPLLGHAGWDVYHHRVDRVVDRALAEFCAVLDVLVAVLVAVIALSS